MHLAPCWLVNTPDIELWPSPLLRARGNRDARALARSRWLLRRKQDGRFLAASLPEGLLPLVPRLSREPGLDAALDALSRLESPLRQPPPDSFPDLPLDPLMGRLHALGLDPGYGRERKLAMVQEPPALTLAGFDRYRRPLWLTRQAARAWQGMRRAAWADGVRLEAISGYRSHAYQLGIFRRKFARGLSLAQILAVNAAPGYSEHHSGRALDIGAPGEPAAEPSFESTAAFRWLQAHAAGHGFRLSYPRDNPHGIVHEPWHWCWHPALPPATDRPVTD